MRKKKQFDKAQYKDEIWVEDNDGNETLFWGNDWRDDRWGNDNDIDSEYNKMMDLHRDYNFLEYDSCPNFIHYTIERNMFGEIRKINNCSLVEEYFNT